MLKEYEIEVEELLQKVVKIEANSLEEALDIAKEMYSNEEIILDYNDIKDTSFKEFNEENEQEKSKKHKYYDR